MTDVELSPDQGMVSVHVAYQANHQPVCTRCQQACARYDRRQRQWLHLDTCQYQTILVADVPRVNCPTHGVVTVVVPWATAGSGFTALFEALVIRSRGYRNKQRFANAIYFYLGGLNLYPDGIKGH